jgi:hypothetical protein
VWEYDHSIIDWLRHRKIMAKCNMVFLRTTLGAYGTRCKQRDDVALSSSMVSPVEIRSNTSCSAPNALQCNKSYSFALTLITPRSCAPYILQMHQIASEVCNLMPRSLVRASVHPRRSIIDTSFPSTSTISITGATTIAPAFSSATLWLSEVTTTRSSV